MHLRRAVAASPGGEAERRGEGCQPVGGDGEPELFELILARCARAGGALQLQGAGVKQAEVAGECALDGLAWHGLPGMGADSAGKGRGVEGVQQVQRGGKEGRGRRAETGDMLVVLVAVEAGAGQGHVTVEPFAQRRGQ